MFRAMPASGPVAATFLVTIALFVAMAGTAHAKTADDIALLNAVLGGNIDEVERLLEKGVDPNVHDQWGRTALHLAAQRADALILEALLESGGNPNLQDPDGETPLMPAARFPYDERMSQLAIRILLRFGARPEIADNWGQTPLYVVAGNHRQPTSARDLLAAGADPNRQEPAGRTPLHASVGRESKLSADMVQALVDGGARGNIVAAGGETPLQRFVRVGSNDGRIVDALVEAGSDVDAKNRRGESPLHTAIRNGGSSENNRVVEALLAAGADPCIKDASGYIPYNTAREGGEVHTMLANAGGSDIGCEGSEEIVADYIVDPADWSGETTARSNIRSGPGTDHDVVTTLDVRTPVHVTGTVRNTDWLEVEVGGSTAFVHASLVEKIETETAMEPSEEDSDAVFGTKPETAQAMPDEATVKRVANWMARCVELHREVAKWDRDIASLLRSQPDRALDALEESGGPVEAAEEYMNTCMPVDDHAIASGYNEHCWPLAQEIVLTIGVYPREWLAQPNDALEHLEAAGARHLGEEYLQACVPLIAAAIDGGPIDEVAAETKPETAEDTTGESGVESVEQEEASGVGATVAPLSAEPKCTDDTPMGSGCWRELHDYPGCHVWTDSYSGPRNVTWTGTCSGGFADGHGSLTMHYPPPPTGNGQFIRESTGRLVEGVRQGHWVDAREFSRGEGDYVDGRRHGHWNMEGESVGGIPAENFEGSYVDGLPQGHWSSISSDGNFIVEGSFVDGQPSGLWTWDNRADNTYTAMPYVEGKPHGQSSWRSLTGETYYQCWQHGEEVAC